MGNMFSTNFAADSKRLITNSINGREILFCSSSQTFNKLITSSKQCKNESSSSVPAAILIFGGKRKIPFQSIIFLLRREGTGVVRLVGRGILLNDDILNVRELRC